MDDDDIRESLLKIDHDDDANVSQFEADFIETICFKYSGALSEKQRECAERIIDKYS